MKFLRTCIVLAGLLPLVAMAAAPGMPLQPFTATYKVLRKGSPLGVATLTLRRNADGTWTYRSHIDARHGMAGMLGGSIRSTSRFRWHDGRIETLRYDYRMHVAVISKQRHVAVDWQKGTVSVQTSDDGDFHYRTTPGLVERHVLVLALGRALASGKTHMALPVAVKDRVQTQTFAVRGHEAVSVPAGTIEAVRVERTHDDKGYSAWYDPAHYGMAPVKLAQEAGGDITLLLKSFQR